MGVAAYVAALPNRGYAWVMELELWAEGFGACVGIESGRGINVENGKAERNILTVLRIPDKVACSKDTDVSGSCLYTSTLSLKQQIEHLRRPNKHLFWVGIALTPLNPSWNMG